MNTLVNSKNIIKSIIIIFSAFFWIYFLVSSGLTMQTIIVFDIVSIINSVVTINFLLFLIFFPLTSVIILSVIFNSSKQESLIIVISSLLLVILSSIIFFGLNFYFIVFLLLYILSHVILCLIFQKDQSKSAYNNSSEWLSKLAIFLVIASFISTALYIYPHQKERAEEMEAGVVNLFVSDDLNPWISTSYAISQQCTRANIDYIADSSEYLALKAKTDKESIDFTEFMDNLRIEISKEKTADELKSIMPDLDTTVIKGKVITTIKQIPFMVIVENYFSIFFSLIFTSIIYSYLSIVFLIFAAFIYLFNIIFKEDK